MTSPIDIWTEGTHRYTRDPDDPAIRVCLEHDAELGLYDDEQCAG